MSMNVALINDSKSNELLSAAVATGAGDTNRMSSVYASFHAIANATSGAYSATVKIQVSNDNTNWIDMGTISLSGTGPTADTDGLTSNTSWKYVRANVTAISGTGANVTVVMG